MFHTPISILVVEDDRVSRIGLKLMLQSDPELVIIGEAEDGREAVNKALELRPNVILMDIGLPRLDGLEATSLIKSNLSECKVIMLTSHNEDEDVRAAIAVGADGYCLKDISHEELVEGIRIVHSGEFWQEARIMPLRPTQSIEIKSLEL